MNESSADEEPKPDG